MKRILHTILMLLVASVTFAQSYPRKCTEEDIPSSERQRYFDEAKKHVNYYYVQIPAAIGDLDNREVLIDAIMAKGQTSLKPEFLLEGIKSLAPVSPDQYFSKLDTQFKDMVDDMEFQVSNLSLGTIMMKTGVSCYIPVEYDLVLQNQGKTLFKRRCRMYCFFPRLAASKLIKTMQVEPVRDIIAYQPLEKEVMTKRVRKQTTSVRVKGVVTNKSDLQDTYMSGVNNETKISRCVGQVIDGKVNEPMIGASVTIKGNKTHGTITYLDGTFDLGPIKHGEVIVISFVGYRTKKIKWNGQFLKIIMK